jgi:hypothetical protein
MDQISKSLSNLESSSISSTIPSIVDEEDTLLEIEELKERGNLCVAAGGYQQASILYTTTITKSTRLLCTLYSNRAHAHLKLHSYESSLRDCENVLAIDASHVKASFRKKECLKAYKHTAAEQQAGRYDFLTLPFDAFHQNSITNYYGPIIVGMTQGKGRGLFTTRDVQAGELLFLEKAFAFRRHSRSHSHSEQGVDPEDSHLDSQTNLISDIVTIIESDPKANAILSYLQTDKEVVNRSIPDFQDFRNDEFALKPKLTASEVRGAVETNCFAFHMGNEPSIKDREQMAESLTPGVSRQAFYNGLLYRAKRAQVYANIRQQKKSERLQLNLNQPTTSAATGAEVPISTVSPSAASLIASDERAGTGLWIVGSFMNHSTDPTATREFVGQLFVCHAWRALRKGEELTNTYSTDAVTLQKWGIH